MQYESPVGKEIPLVLQEVPIMDNPQQFEQFELAPVVMMEGKEDLEAPIASDRALIQKLEAAAEIEPSRNAQAYNLPLPNTCTSNRNADAQK